MQQAGHPRGKPNSSTLNPMIPTVFKLARVFEQF